MDKQIKTPFAMISVLDIHKELRYFARGGNVYIPEFTFGTKRIDAVIVDTKHRWIRGFEIKISKADFDRDMKWTQYSRFCSSVSIVCPEGLIDPSEIEKPFGLLWLMKEGFLQWKKRPKNIQKRNSLSWLWTYVEVLEFELPRLNAEAQDLKIRNKYLEESNEQ